MAYRTILMPDETMEYKGRNGWGKMGKVGVGLNDSSTILHLDILSSRSNGDTAPCKIMGQVAHVRALLVALLEELDLAVADNALGLPPPPCRMLEVPDAEHA